MDLSPAAGRLFATMLERRSGQQLTPERSWRIGVALRPLLRQHDIATLDELANRLARGRDPALEEATVDALVNHETFFFRDTAAFAALTDVAVPRLAEARARERRLRIWCAGCSTGQEAYSLAMAFGENETRWSGWSIEIVATDVSGPSIARAAEGRYTQLEVQRGLPIRRLLRWFESDDRDWRVIAPLRSRVRFEERSLLDAPPPPRSFDVILCRNVLLYFPRPLRCRLLDQFAQALPADGILMLGAGETVLGASDRFVADSDHRGLYRVAAGAVARQNLREMPT